MPTVLSWRKGLTRRSIGDADAMALKDARDAANARMGAVAKGGDASQASAR